MLCSLVPQGDPVVLTTLLRTVLRQRLVRFVCVEM